MPKCNRAHVHTPKGCVHACIGTCTRLHKPPCALKTVVGVGVTMGVHMLHKPPCAAHDPVFRCTTVCICGKR
jgi:hypothetical protein